MRLFLEDQAVHTRSLGPGPYEDERTVFLQGYVQNYAKPLSLKVMPIDPGNWPDVWPLCLPMNTNLR